MHSELVSLLNSKRTTESLCSLESNQTIMRNKGNELLNNDGMSLNNDDTHAATNRQSLRIANFVGHCLLFDMNEHVANLKLLILR